MYSRLNCKKARSEVLLRQRLTSSPPLFDLSSFYVNVRNYLSDARRFSQSSLLLNSTVEIQSLTLCFPTMSAPSVHSKCLQEGKIRSGKRKIWPRLIILIFSFVGVNEHASGHSEVQIIYWSCSLHNFCAGSSGFCVWLTLKCLLFCLNLEFINPQV